MGVRRGTVRMAAVLAGGALAASCTWAASGLAADRPYTRSAAALPTAGTGSGARWWQAEAAPGSTAGPLAGAKVSFLSGVYCTARRNCWAVGLHADGSGPILSQALHWNGTTWHKVTVPNPGGTGAGDSSEVTAVRCAAASECWAVGLYQKNSGPVLAEMLRWNGKKWSAMAVPQPAGTGKTALNQLTDVTCIAARNCWAAGYFGKSGSGTLNLVLHWNGTKWKRVRVPEAGGASKQADNELNGIRCPTTSRCLAVGSYSTGSGSNQAFNQVLTWNGRSWTAQRLPNPGSGTPDYQNTLLGIGCGAKAACWAVGTREPTNDAHRVLNQVLHWNGHSWSRQLITQPGGTTSPAQNELAGITCTTARNCWAVGFDGAFSRNQAQHWNGKHWVLVHTPDPALPGVVPVDELFGVRCTDAAHCWAVGAQESPGLVSNEILHWNGKAWSVWT
jgi:hypothetical protein